MNLPIALQAEMLKTRRTSSWYLTIIGSAILPAMLLVDLFFDELSPETLRDPVNVIYQQSLKGLSLVMLPFYIILMCTLLAQVEYRNSTWKQVFSSPQSMQEIFLSKFLNMQLLVLLFLLLFNVFMGVVLLAACVIQPQIGTLHQGIKWEMLIEANQQTYVCVIGMSTLQFLLGLNIKNFIVPVALGLVLWITGGILVFEIHSWLGAFFPFSFPAMVMFDNYKNLMPAIQVRSVGYALLLLALGFRWFCSRRLRA